MQKVILHSDMHISSNDEEETMLDYTGAGIEGACQGGWVCNRPEVSISDEVSLVRPKDLAVSGPSKSNAGAQSLEKAAVRAAAE